jgi:dehydrogenase/reductase SDR family member 1
MDLKRAERPLEGKVAVVTGASRGVGKGIALSLGEAGAKVYVTGRSLSPGSSNWPGTVAETVRQIEELGGTAVAVRCDHGNDEEVRDLFARIERDEGRLDVLVNNVFGAPDRMPTTVPFWDLPEDLWDQLLTVGLRSHYVASRCAAPMMVKQCGGLIVNTSSGGAVRYVFNVPFGVQKAGVDKLAHDMAHDLKPFGVAAVSIWPGFIKSEKLLAQPDRLPPEQAKYILENGESAQFAGRGVVALASDSNVMDKSGRVLLVAELAEEYGFTDVDGKIPAAPARG